MTKEDIIAMNPGGKLDYWVDIYIFKQRTPNTKRYSTDWGAMGEVVEKMVELGYHYNLNLLHNIKHPEPVRHACFSKISINYTGDPLYAIQNDFIHYHARCKTAPEATIKASLLAIMELEG